MTPEALEIETADAPRTSIIVLHGLGADGNDFVPICDELDLRAVGPVRFALRPPVLVPSWKSKASKSRV